MVGCASGSKTHTNTQRKEQALFLTTKKLIISAQSKSWFLSTITEELFLLTSLAARRFSCLLKTFVIFGARCKLVRLVFGHNLPAVPIFVSDFYQLLPLSNTLPGFFGKFLDMRQIWLDAFNFRFNAFKNGIQFGIKLKLFLVPFGLKLQKFFI